MDNVIATVLIVDPDPETGREISAFLSSRQYAVEWVDDAEKAFNLVDSRLFDVLITEMHIRKNNRYSGDGMRLMTVARNRNPDVCVVLIAERPDVARATEAIRLGASDFQTKPLNLPKLDAVIQREIGHQRLAMERHTLQRRLDERYSLANMIGQSRRILQVYTRARYLAGTDAPILIRGEAGSGKDMLAQAIHNNSRRRDEPFVKVDCEHLNAAQLELELFGTGAGVLQKGCVELAEGGTLFLDELSGVAHSIQERLVRIMKHHRFERTRETRLLRADVRIIAATVKTFERLSSDEAMDSALLELFQDGLIEAPVLRTRRDDIPLLVDHFIRQASEKSGKPVAGVTPYALDLLMQYDWPENVRELKSVVEGMLISAPVGSMIDIYHVPHHIRHAAGTELKEETDVICVRRGSTMQEVERQVIEETLRDCGYNKEKCACILQIGLRTLYRKLKEYNIR